MPDETVDADGLRIRFVVGQDHPEIYDRLKPVSNKKFEILHLVRLGIAFERTFVSRSHVQGVATSALNPVEAGAQTVNSNQGVPQGSVETMSTSAEGVDGMQLLAAAGIGHEYFSNVPTTYTE